MIRVVGSKEGQCLISLRDDRIADGPLDVKVGIRPPNPTLAVLIVNLVYFVYDVRGFLAQDAETVRESRRNPEHPAIFFVDLDSEGRPVGRGVLAKVDRDVPDGSTDDSDELSLGGIELIVKTTQHPGPGTRMIVLNEVSGQTIVSK